MTTERYQKFIRDSISKIATVTMDEELKEIDTKVLELGIKDFFDADSYIFVYDILNYRLTDPRFKYENNFPDDAFLSSYATDTEEAARFLAKSKRLFRRALDSKDVRLLLTALIIFRRFGCGYDILFDLSELEYDKRLWLTDCLVRLSGTTMKIDFQGDAPDYEKGLFKNYSSGHIQFSIKATYQFVDALERSNISYSHYLADEATKLLHYVDADEFAKQLKRQHEPLKIIPLLGVLSYDEKLKLLQNAYDFSEWIYFEIFRQLIGRQTSDTNEISIQTISLGISNLYTRNPKFSLQTSYYFQSDPLFSSALGTALVGVSSKDFGVFVQKIELDEFKNPQRFRAVCNLLENLEEHGSENQVLYFCKTVYRKWHALLNESLTEGKYFAEPIVTDYFCCILRYLELKIDTSLKAKRAVSKIINSLEEVNSIWFKSVTGRDSYYFALLSTLYVQSFLWKTKSFDFTATSSVKRRLVTVLSDERTRLISYRRVEQSTLYEEMAENFGIALK